MSHTKILVSVFEYWRSKLKERPIPARADIVPGELREFLPFLFIADVQKDAAIGAEITLRLVGTHIERTFGIDLTGLPVGGLNKHWPDFVVGRDLFDVVNQPAVIVATHEFCGPDIKEKFALNNSNRANLCYQRLVLPLSSDGKNVDRILGALVKESSENTWALWQAPFMFKEHSKRTFSYPYHWTDHPGPAARATRPERQRPV